MSSREIADLTGKRHADVLEAIRNMEPAWEKVTERKFSLSVYTDSTGRKLPCYELNKEETLFVATKFNDEARAILILRWKELEEKNQIGFSIPTTFAEALRLAADKEEQLQEANKKLEEQKPQVLFAKALETSNQSILIGQLAKILKQNGIDIGQNRLFEKLREEGYLMKSGEQYNGPTQKSMDLNLFETKTTTVNNPDGSVRVTRTTKVTPKGQSYFINKFVSYAVANRHQTQLKLN